MHTLRNFLWSATENVVGGKLHMGLSEESHGEVNSGQKKQRKLGTSKARSAALTIKMPPAMLERIENMVAEVQSMAKTRAPDKADVLVWMLTAVKPEELRKKLDAWNAVFE